MVSSNPTASRNLFTGIGLSDQVADSQMEHCFFPLARHTQRAPWWYFQNVKE